MDVVSDTIKWLSGTSDQVSKIQQKTSVTTITQSSNMLHTDSVGYQSQPAKKAIIMKNNYNSTLGVKNGNEFRELMERESIKLEAEKAKIKLDANNNNNNVIIMKVPKLCNYTKNF